MITKSFSK